MQGTTLRIASEISEVSIFRRRSAKGGFPARHTPSTFIVVAFHEEIALLLSAVLLLFFEKEFG
jgi:hypothetical protein